jgi:hypothetical protein
MLFSRAFSTYGSAGLIGVKVILGGLTALCLWWAVTACSTHPLVRLPVFLACLSSAGRFFLFRPQLVTFAGFSLFVAVLFRRLVSRSGRLWVLPLFMLVWANCHGAFLAGLGAIGLAGGLSAAQIWFSDRVRDAARTLGLFCATFVACGLATAVNPWGPRLWTYVLAELAHDTNRRYIAEWQPLSWNRDPWSLALIAGLTAALSASAFAASRRRKLVHGVPPWIWAVSAAPLIFMSFQSERHVPLSTIWMAPVVALLADAAFEAEAKRPSWFTPAWIAFASGALVPVLVTFGIVAARPAPQIAAGGTLLGTRNPCQAVTFMRDNGVRGNVFTPLWWGSYITWRTYPAVRVSMDGRNITLFPDRMVEENLRFYSRDATREDLDVPFRYSTDFLLMPSNAPILPAVRQDSRWQPFYSDRDTVLFVRTDRAFTQSSFTAVADTRSVEVCGDVLLLNSNGR